jgi:hypothetical protein
MSNYDTWKTRSDYDEEARYYSGPSQEQVEQAIAVRQKEIEWNIRRLGNLILDDEDRQQTEDLIMDLRGEIESLRRCFNVA